MTEPGPQRRRHPRYHVNLEVTLFLSNSTMQSRITQISRGGCLMFPVLPQQPSPSVKLSFRLNDELPPVNCKGEVVYSIQDKGTGVAFTEISIHNQDRIADFCEKQVAAGKATSA